MQHRLYLHCFTFCYKSGLNPNIHHLIMYFMTGKVRTVSFGLVGKKACDTFGYTGKERLALIIFRTDTPVFCLLTRLCYQSNHLFWLFGFWFFGFFSLCFPAQFRCLFPLVVVLLPFYWAFSAGWLLLGARNKGHSQGQQGSSSPLHLNGRERWWQPGQSTAQRTPAKILA